MQSEIPSQSHVWGVLSLRFHSELTVSKSEVCRFCGLLKEFGSGDDNVNREREEKEVIKELTGLLLQAIAEDAAARHSPIAQAAKPVVRAKI